MTNRKICFFNSCRTWGGGEKWHFDAACSLANRGFEVCVAGFPGGELHQRVKDADLPWWSAPIRNLSFLNPHRILTLFRQFRKLRPDVVILNLPSDLKAAGVAARMAGVKRIIYRRGSSIPIRDSRLNRLLFRYVVSDVIANSEETKRTVLAKNEGLFPSEKIQVIYNGIDLKTFDSQSSKPLYSRQPGEVILGHAGRLSQEKNQKFLIDVALNLKAQGFSFKLLIAGKGECEGELKAYAKKQGVEREVVFVGFVKDVPAFMKSIDIFLLSSLWEGFGYVLVEAMAAGKPAVAFDNSSSPEIVADGQTGYLVPLGDLEGYAARTGSLMEDAKLREKMGASGRRRAEDHFDQELTVDALVRMLRPQP